MSFCQSCGSNFPEGSAFCIVCGAARNAAPPQQQVMSGAVSAVAAPAPANAAMTPPAAAALSYLAGAITGILFVVLDPYKNDPFVRFHAMQSIFFNVAWIGIWGVWMVLSMILTPLTVGIFGLIALPVMLLLSVCGFGYWLFLMYQASQQKWYHVPFIGKFAEQQAHLHS